MTNRRGSLTDAAGAENDLPPASGSIPKIPGPTFSSIAKRGSSLFYVDAFRPANAIREYGMECRSRLAQKFFAHWYYPLQKRPFIGSSLIFMENIVFLTGRLCRIEATQDCLDNSTRKASSSWDPVKNNSPIFPPQKFHKEPLYFPVYLFNAATSLKIRRNLNMQRLFRGWKA